MREDIRLIPTTEYRPGALATRKRLRRSQVRRSYIVNDIRHLGHSIAAAVRSLAAAELLFLSWFGILSSTFEEWTVNRTQLWKLQGILVLLIVLAEIVAPLCRRLRVLVYVATELTGLAAYGWYCLRHMDLLLEGITEIFDDYLLAWNAYYHTNYLGWDAGKEQIGYTLTVMTAALIFVFLMLRYLTGVRFFMLVSPFAAVALGLLVDVQPDWKSLALLLMGVITLYGGERETSKILFDTIPGEKHRGCPALVRQLLTVVFTGLLIGASGMVFAAPAAKIAEKMPQFRAFQENLENQVQSMGTKWFESDKEYVNNATPEYSDTLVAQIEADAKPNSNLYLADFYSGTYQNGQWKQDDSAFENAAGKDDIDGERLGMLLRQMPYEYICQSEAVSSDDLFTYTLSYYIKGSRAWLPYFSDVTSASEDVWVDGEGLVRKKRSTDSISFVGWNQNEVLLSYGQYGLDGDEEEDAADWYSAYVLEHYLDSANLAAVKEAADEIYADQGLDELYRDFYDDSKDEQTINLYRCMMASAVQEWLEETADYNLYLDDIPSGTDTMAYFLETGHEGYCMHFASAGVLILQELGVPARYASGYIVKRSAFHWNDGQYVADIYDRNGHAWAEIYLEGIGWVPFEMTPGYFLTADSLPTDASQQEALQGKHAQKTREDSQAEQESQADSPSEEDEVSSEEAESEEAQAEKPQDETSGTQQLSGTDTEAGENQAGIGAKDSVNWAKVCWVMGILLAAAAAIMLAWTALRRKIRQYREVLLKDMQCQRYRSAVRRINRRIYRRILGSSLLPLKKARLHKFGDGALIGLTDAQYERKLAEAYPAVSPEMWADYMEIVKKCAFSKEEISREEAEHCYRIYRQVCDRQ